MYPELGRLPQMSWTQSCIKFASDCIEATFCDCFATICDCIPIVCDCIEATFPATFYGCIEAAFYGCIQVAFMIASKLHSMIASKLHFVIVSHLFVIASKLHSVIALTTMPFVMNICNEEPWNTMLNSPQIVGWWLHMSWTPQAHQSVKQTHKSNPNLKGAHSSSIQLIYVNCNLLQSLVDNAIYCNHLNLVAKIWVRHETWILPWFPIRFPI